MVLVFRGKGPVALEGMIARKLSCAPASYNSGILPWRINFSMGYDSTGMQVSGYHSPH
jgi:hypothetical protein